MSEKFIGYFRLVDACGAPGCPVCRCVTHDSRQYLDALLYEQVTDPDTRRRLRASWGFCNWHVWMLLEIVNAYAGAAIIYEDLVGLFIDRVRRFAQRTLGRGSWFPPLGRRRRTLLELYRRRQICPACANTADAERRYLEMLAGFVNDPEAQLAYARSDGLCAPHALGALEAAGDTADVRALLDRTLQKWAKLRDDLESFVRKHDYRNTEAYTEAESASYLRAFEMLAGARGVFGNDLHAASEPARRRAATPPRAAPRGNGAMPRVELEADRHRDPERSP